MMVRLAELARVVRSKNVGPFMMALDVVFDDRETYETVVKANVITRESIAAMYKVPMAHVAEVTPYPQGNAIKVAMLRLIPSGNFGDADVLGCQQYAPIHELDVPVNTPKKK